MIYEFAAYLIADEDGTPEIKSSQEFTANLPGVSNFLAEVTQTVYAQRLISDRDKQSAEHGYSAWERRTSQIVGYVAYALPLESNMELQLLIRAAVVPCLS